jgi:hypothetical protein
MVRTVTSPALPDLAYTGPPGGKSTALDISNRSLVLLLMITLVLVGFAGVLTAGLSMSASRITADVAVALAPETLVQPHVERRGGGQTIDPQGPLLLKLGAGASAGSAMLVCDMYKSERPFVRGELAFPTLPYGDCSVRLSGTTTAYAPVYPGDALVCAGAEDVTQCTGGLAAEHAGTVSVTSALPGALSVDGEPLGRLPQTDLHLKIGRRQLEVTLEDGRTLRWSLIVQPGERVFVNFPSPDGDASDPSGVPPTGSSNAAPRVASPGTDGVAPAAGTDAPVPASAAIEGAGRPR